MTADHRNFAVVGPSGSRTSGFLDGHAGAAYDQVQTVPPVLSPDGKRWAYTASKSGQNFMVVDGKEYGPYTSFPQFTRGFPGGIPMPFEATPRWPIVFSPDSKHFAFIAQNGTASVVVEDGIVISPAGIAVDAASKLIFSKQGDHLAFVARNQNTSNVILDSVAGPAYQTTLMPQFSDDGHHLLYVAAKAPGKYMVVLDGKEGAVFDSLGNNSGGNILISPDASHVAYTAASNAGPAGAAKSGAVIDGTFMSAVDRFWISPNGKYEVYLNHPVDANGAMTRVEVVINGKVGQDYVAFNDLHFAPDGHPIYSMRAANGKTFVVENEKESDGYDSADLSSAHFSADGKHTAYVATVGGKQFVVLDNKKETLPNEYSAVLRPTGYNADIANEKMLQFTPDGHIVYHSSRYGNPSLVKDDQVLADDGMVSPDGRRAALVKMSAQGTSTATAQLTLDGQAAGRVFGTITKMAFSPDSQHFAYVGVSNAPIPSGKEGGYFLVVDGVQKGEYAEITDLQYSPDSQHLFHATSSHIYGGPTRNYMDQQLYFTSLWLPGGSPDEWLDDHHTMQIIGGKYNATTYSAADPNFYRVRYFLPGADRKQDTAAVAGPSAVDMAENKRMLGSGAGASVAAAPAATAPAPAAPVPQGGSPAANNTAASPGIPAATAAPAVGGQAASVAPTPGTNVQVRLVDPVNTATDGLGKRYRAAVTKAVKSGPVTIVAGPATLTFFQNGAAWVAQLTSVTINGQVVAVSSNQANVPTGALQGAASTVNSALGSVFGRKPANPAPAAAGDSRWRPVRNLISF